MGREVPPSRVSLADLRRQEMIAYGGVLTARDYWALSSLEKEKISRGSGLWGGGNLSSD